MKKGIILFCISFLTMQVSVAQSSNESIIERSEVGVDLAFSASTFGGNFGIGLKYGVTFGEYFIAGPSVRYERLWWKNIVYNETQKGALNVYGGGGFFHARFFNALFVGAELEVLKSPYSKTGLIASQGNGTWAVTGLLGGGFSMEFNEMVRVNAGIMYDVINMTNSPYRRSYSQTTTSTGAVKYIPILYRLAFFFPLG